MTQAQMAPTGLVRVTVASGTRRVDLVLPGSVPIAELVPELARSVGMLDPQTAYGGYKVVLADGRKLSDELGLIPQGVEDGGVLTISAGIDDKPPRVYDDVVEAMTDVVESEMAPWKPEAGRRTSLVAAALLLLLGAGALWTQESMLAGVAAAVIAVVLAGGAIVLSRLEAESDAAMAVIWMGEVYGAVAGFLLGAEMAGKGDLGMALAVAGGGALVVAAIGMLGLGESRMLALPGGVVGAVFLIAGLLLSGFPKWDAGVVLGIVLVVVVLAGSFFPWLALTTTSTDVPQLYSDEDIESPPDADVDRDQVAVDAKVAHEILVGISLSVGVLVLLTVPFVVQRGLAGTLLAVAACVVLMLRTRQYRTGAEVLVGLVSGIAGLLAVGAALLVYHPSWRPTTAVVLAIAGGALLAMTLIPNVASIRRGRFADLAETICLLAMVPLMVLASGLFGTLLNGGS